MTDIFGFLEVGQWLAILRIGLGLWWIKSFAHKPHKKFVSGQMVNWTLALADNHPVPAFGNLIKKTVEPNGSWFPYLVLAGELAVGIGLVFGFLTPISLAVAIFMNLSYITLAGVKPTKDISINPAYQCEQGQNWNMIVPQVVLFAMGAWSTWSVDAILSLPWVT